MRYLVSFLLLNLFIGCASTDQYRKYISLPNNNISPEYLPSDGRAKIYVLRKFSVFGAGVGIRISDTGQTVGRIGPGGILAWERMPGQMVIGASASNDSNITLTVNDGDVYFLETRPNWGNAFSGAVCEIRLLSSKDGQALLAQITEKVRSEMK